MRRLLKREKIEADTLDMKDYQKLNAMGLTAEQRELAVREIARMNNVNRILKRKAIYVPLQNIIPLENSNYETRKMLRACWHADFIKYKKGAEVFYITNKGYEFAKSLSAACELCLKRYSKWMTFLVGLSPSLVAVIIWFGYRLLHHLMR